MQDNKAEVLDTVARAAPPATVSFLGLTQTYLSNTVYALTIVYIIFQLIVMFPKVKEVFKKKEKNESN